MAENQKAEAFRMASLLAIQLYFCVKFQSQCVILYYKILVHRKTANNASKSPENHIKVGQPIALGNVAWNMARSGLSIESSKQGLIMYYNASILLNT